MLLGTKTRFENVEKKPVLVLFLSESAESVAVLVPEMGRDIRPRGRLICLHGWGRGRTGISRSHYPLPRRTIELKAVGIRGGGGCFLIPRIRRFGRRSCIQQLDVSETETD